MPFSKFVENVGEWTLYRAWSLNIRTGFVHRLDVFVHDVAINATELGDNCMDEFASTD